MSQEKNATDDPPRSPPDQGGAVNRSFSIHEIDEMSDDDADGYRAALDERAARRARRCALSAPQAAESLDAASALGRALEGVTCCSLTTESSLVIAQG